MCLKCVFSSFFLFCLLNLIWQFCKEYKHNQFDLMAIRTQVGALATGGCMRCIGRWSGANNVVKLIWNKARAELRGRVDGVCDAAGKVAADLAGRIVDVAEWCDGSSEEWLGLGVAGSELTVFVGSWKIYTKFFRKNCPFVECFS